MKRFFILLVVLTISFTGFLPGASAQNVDMPDANLAAAVRGALDFELNIRLGAADPIPQSVLRQLTVLTAIRKGISDLTGLEEATGLTQLTLNVNAISDVSPLAGLTGLTILSLGNNEINDITPLAGLTNLTSLSLQNNKINDITPLARLTNLTLLTLWNNGVRDVSPLSELTSLTGLYFSDNEVNDITALARLTNLTQLHLRNNKLRGITPLARLTNLEGLDIEGNEVRDVSPLAGLTNLTLLHISRNKINDISPLARLTGLTALYLRGSEVRDVHPIEDLVNLRTLWLRDTPIADLSPLRAIRERNPDILLDIPAVTEISVVEPPAGGPYLPGSAITIQVTFEDEDAGWNFEGDTPPYFTLYFGEPVRVNERRVIWTRAESPSSTLMFTYQIQAGDIADSVTLESTRITVPQGTSVEWTRVENTFPVTRRFEEIVLLLTAEPVNLEIASVDATPPVVTKPPAIIPPAQGQAYTVDDEIEVAVTFDEENVRFEGDSAPYITLYLGEQTLANARHATWQSGSERPGSTIVTFAYPVQVGDMATRVSVDLSGVAIPRGVSVIDGDGNVQVGDAAPAVAPGTAVSSLPIRTEGTVAFVNPTSGEAFTSPSLETDVVTFLPILEVPVRATYPESSVPRSPVVFNELGNGSGDTNDWLELRNVSGSDVSLKDWELSVVQDGNKEDTSLIVFPDVSVPANGLLLITNSDPSADGNMLAGGENKGLTHQYIVNAGLSLPDDGKFLLILRNAKEKLGLNEAFIDVAGGGGSGTDAFVRETAGDYDTHVWPLQVGTAPGADTEDALGSGKVWQRAKADIVGYHKDAWAEAAFTGLGYDRKVSKSAATAGTPGYPNVAPKGAAATGSVTFSEIMVDSGGGTLPQWIELYNNSKTEALNINRWKLEIQNVDSEDLVGRPIVTLTLEEKVIQPNQTLLIVAGDARASSADVFPADRVYNLLALHEKNLRIKSARDTFLSAKGCYLKLIDRSGNVVDEMGNTDGDRRTEDDPMWALPVLSAEGPRSSIIRRYTKGVASDGTSRYGWVLSANFKQFKADGLHYGHADDIGTPGYRQGGALPVELSGFSVTREENGAVLLTWTTESEVDNAGFNVRRSLRRDSGFTLLNPVLIAGAGTTGERQTYTFIDTSAKPGVEHYYQLEEVSLSGQPQVLVTRRLRGPVSPANRALKTLGEVKSKK